MTAKNSQDEGLSQERLRDAMERYAELQKKVAEFPPRRQFTVVPTVDKWSTDIASLGVGPKGSARKAD